MLSRCHQSATAYAVVRHLGILMTSFSSSLVYHVHRDTSYAALLSSSTSHHRVYPTQCPTQIVSKIVEKPCNKSGIEYFLFTSPNCAIVRSTIHAIPTRPECILETELDSRHSRDKRLGILGLNIRYLSIWTLPEESLDLHVTIERMSGEPHTLWLELVKYWALCELKFAPMTSHVFGSAGSNARQPLTLFPEHCTWHVAEGQIQFMHAKNLFVRLTPSIVSMTVGELWYSMHRTFAAFSLTMMVP